ncbi:MAG: hypothetical protein P9M03_08110, partial [Candidatus Theseobacter exili]|nr:hypothetical protein [Candidatus Theseobacter exili]
LQILTFTYGSFLGVFILGTTNKRSWKDWPNIAGMCISIISLLLIKIFTPLAWPWFIVIGTVITYCSCFVLSYKKQ